MLLQIIDASKNFDKHIQTAENVLKDLEARAIPILKVFNKIDMISNERLLLLEKLYPEAVFVSALENRIVGQNKRAQLVEKLRKKILIFFDDRMQTLRIRLDYENSQKLARIYEWSKVDKIEFQEDGILMTLTTIPGNFDRLRHDLGENFTELGHNVNA